MLQVQVPPSGPGQEARKHSLSCCGPGPGPPLPSLWVPWNSIPWAHMKPQKGAQSPPAPRASPTTTAPLLFFQPLGDTGLSPGGAGAFSEQPVPPTRRGSHEGRADPSLLGRVTASPVHYPTTVKTTPFLLLVPDNLESKCWGARGPLSLFLFSSRLETIDM